jgi:hypothetical protein
VCEPHKLARRGVLSGFASAANLVQNLLTNLVNEGTLVKRTP